MKAYVLNAVNDFALAEVEMPQAAKGEVLVKVTAAGICGSDVPRVYRTGTYSYPLIPGHEFAGEVIALGEEVHERWKGKRVGIFPLIPCMNCEQCRKKEYEMCRKYNYLGSRCNGGFAEYVAVPEWNLIALPDAVSDEAAAMLEPMCVAAHATRDLPIGETDTVAVCGLGTIGMSVLMLLKAQGIKHVLAIGNKESQKETVQKIGYDAEFFCDSRNTDVNEWVKEQTKGYGVNFFLECVGKSETVTQAVANTVPGGHIRLVGNPHSDILLEKSVYWMILRNQLTLSGIWNSSFTKTEEDDWHYVLRLLSEDKLQPEILITHKYEFSKLLSGFEMIRDKKEDYIKVMTVMM